MFFKDPQYVGKRAPGSNGAGQCEVRIESGDLESAPYSARELLWLEDSSVFSSLLRHTTLKEFWG